MILLLLKPVTSVNSIPTIAHVMMLQCMHFLWIGAKVSESEA